MVVRITNSSKNRHTPRGEREKVIEVRQIEEG